MNGLDIFFKDECYRAPLEDHKSKYSILDIALPSSTRRMARSAQQGISFPISFLFGLL